MSAFQLWLMIDIDLRIMGRGSRPINPRWTERSRPAVWGLLQPVSLLSSVPVPVSLSSSLRSKIERQEPGSWRLLPGRYDREASIQAPRAEDNAT